MSPTIKQLECSSSERQSHPFSSKVCLLTCFPFLTALPNVTPFFKLQVKTQCSLQIPFFPITPYVIFWKSCQFSFADNFQIYLLLSLSLPLPPQSKFPPSFTWTITFGLFSDGIFHNVILFSLYHLVKNLQ